MRRYSDKHSAHTLNELNVTPLLDLVFVLLLIFMMATPLMENSNEVVLPTGPKGGQPVEHSEVIHVTLTRDNTVKVDTDVVPLTRLTETIAEMKTKKPEMVVLVRAHHELPVQRLMEVVDAVKAAKVTKVGLVKTAAAGSN